MHRKLYPAFRIPGAASGTILAFYRKPDGTSGRILEKYRMTDPANELKRRIRRVFSFPGLPAEFLGESPNSIPPLRGAGGDKLLPYIKCLK